jgi:hypothetical protein
MVIRIRHRRKEQETMSGKDVREHSFGLVEIDRSANMPLDMIRGITYNEGGITRHTESFSVRDP